MIIRLIIASLNRTLLFFFCIRRILYKSNKIGFPTAPEEQRPTLSLRIWRQKALLPEFSYFFLCEQMVFLFRSCQIFPITITHLLRTYYVLGFAPDTQILIFFLNEEFLFKFMHKNEEKNYILCCERVKLWNLLILCYLQ